MARFKNIETGSVVSVDDSKADSDWFRSGWERVDEKPAAKPAVKKTSTNKK